MCVFPNMIRDQDKKKSYGSVKLESVWFFGQKPFTEISVTRHLFFNWRNLYSFIKKKSKDGKIKISFFVYAIFVFTIKRSL